MKDTTINAEFESTYAMIVREEKEHRLPETAVYLLVALSTVFSIWQAVQQPVTVPAGGLTGGAPIAHSAPAQHQV